MYLLSYKLFDNQRQLASVSPVLSFYTNGIMALC